MTTAPLEDRLLVRELYDRYADAAFRCDVEAYLDCWSDDGVRIWAGRACAGKTAMRAQWEAIWTGLRRMGFFTQLGPVEIEADQARSRCWCMEILDLRPDGRRTLVGRYDDLLVRRSGRWLFQRREYSLHMDDPAAAVTG